MADVVALTPPKDRVVVAPKRPAPSVRSLFAWGFMIGLFVASIWATIALNINIASIIDSRINAERFARRMFPLDFPPIGELAAMLWETLSIVVLATVLSVILSIPVAIAAAWNTTRNPFSRTAARFWIVVCRAVPDLVLAIVFFRLFGLGGLPGVLAMGIHSIGMVGKLYSDALESLPLGPEMAMRANGAGRQQRVVAGYLPNWLPQLFSIGLYRFDINLRTSVLLGYVGVGGIGLELSLAMRSLDYQRGMALAFVILVVCVLVELGSQALRHAVKGGSRSDSKLPWVRNARQRSADAAIRAAKQGKLAPPMTPGRFARFAAVVGFLVLLGLAFRGAKIDIGAFWHGLQRLPETIGYFYPPMISEENLLAEVLKGIVATLQIALASTLLGAIIAIPVGILAARNVFPNKALNTFFRVVIVAVRAIPDVILAIIMVVITGLGAVAGTLALSIGTIGMLGKLVADSLEETDVNVQEALRAHGADRGQVFVTATLRQSLPAIVSHILYVFDNHVRAATLLGVVGAGGIGFLLMNAARVAEFRAVTTIVLAILVVVLVVEALSMMVRKALR